MKWFITGGLGFVGLNLINNIFNRFDKSKIDIIIYDSERTSRKSDLKYLHDLNPEIYNLKKNIKIIIGDIRDYKKVCKYSTNSNYFINLAANTGVQPSLKKPLDDASINIEGNLKCLMAFEKIKNKNKKFIFASSGAPIGENKPPFDETSKTNPVSPYGVSKLTCEKYIFFFNKIKKLNCTALRFSNLYGPLSLRKTSVVSKMIKSIKDKQEIVIYGNGNQTRDFLHVTDLCNAIINVCITKKKIESVYQLGSGKETSINKISSLIKNNYSTKIKIVKKNKLLGDVMRNYTKPTKFKKVFNWNTKISLKNGIKQTIKWYDAHY